MYDFLVVGAGLFGAVFTQQAIERGKSVLVLEKRNHIGGNAYTEIIDGIIVHKYGPHIFHTNNKQAWDYVNKFAEFNDYINSPVAFYKGKYYPLPFNMNTFKAIWGNVSVEDAARIIKEQKKAIQNVPCNLEEQAISMVGKDIYEIMIKGYTEKQWGRNCKDLPASIIKRIPVRYNFDNNYFDAVFQGVPIHGYTEMINRMLIGATIMLSTDYLSNKEYFNSLADTVIFTGSIDSFYDYVYGPLMYRKVSFDEKRLELADYQGRAVINYTDSDVPFTRTIEHKWFNYGKDIYGKETEHTVISIEYSSEWAIGDDPYYPINDITNNNLYHKYLKLAQEENKVIFGGRLGTYRYLDMDQVITEALQIAEIIM